MITFTCGVPIVKEWPSYSEGPLGLALGIQDLMHDIRAVTRCGVIADEY